MTYIQKVSFLSLNVYESEPNCKKTVPAAATKSTTCLNALTEIKSFRSALRNNHKSQSQKTILAD